MPGAASAVASGVVDVPSPSQMRFTLVESSFGHDYYVFNSPAGAPLGHLSVMSKDGCVAIGGMRQGAPRTWHEVLAFAMKRIRERGQAKVIWESNAYDKYYKGLWAFENSDPLFKGAAYDGYIMDIPDDIDALLSG